VNTSSRILFFAILCALVLIGVTLVVVRSRIESPIPVTYGESVTDGEPAARLARLEARERNIDETAWAKEMQAQECGRIIESLWDSINAATNKFAVVASFPLGEMVLGKWGPPRELPHGIELREPAGAGPVLSGTDWRGLVAGFQRGGWELAQTEFRHVRFDTDDAGQARRSHFYFSAHLIDVAHTNRAIVEGDLVVDWAPRRTGGGAPAVERVDASGLTLKTRRGEPPFRPVLTETIAPPDKSEYIDPLIVYDLDGDGYPEIILAAKNLVFRRRGGDHYESEPLCRYAPGLITSAVVADFDGDGSADFLCAKPEGLLLFKGSAGGRFDEPGRLVWPANPRLVNVMVLTCGDINHDGNLDVFMGQYRKPDLGQILRPHYYEANDGYPAYLLLGDGRGNLTNATAESGLTTKCCRRVFSASFVDLDGDGNLDLMVTSDFGGLDVYRGDGRGHFRDATADWLTEPQGFGMGHAVADFNGDGRLDILMIGMNSPTADRLEHLGLTRPDSSEDWAMRRRMTFGNRLFLGRPGGGFEQTPMGESIARSGWSWGCSAFDFDNDGFPEAYIANGNRSSASVRDYEREFWLHDQSVDESVDDQTATAYFLAKYDRTLGQGWSYGGYEKNRFYLNQGGRVFLEAGYLMGVALEQDSRNVVADDLDGDGRVDLLVTTFQVWPEAKQTLRVYKNTLEGGGNWIGFRFRESGPGRSTVGVQVTLHCQGRELVKQLTTGDSHRAQHSGSVHFGLGSGERVDTATARWPDGRAVTLREPALNRYHLMVAPDGNTTAP
jgi:hypothetical protein